MKLIPLVGIFPRARCAKEETQKYLQNHKGTQKEHPPPNKKITDTTHTTRGMFPPVVATINKESLL